MTQTMKHQMLGWRRRSGLAALGAALVVTTAFGPSPVATTRTGANETVGYATLSAADTMTSTDVLADVAAAGV